MARQAAGTSAAKDVAGLTSGFGRPRLIEYVMSREAHFNKAITPATKRAVGIFPVC